ncbi:MAG: hypothetical protein ABJ205_04315 [Erythrobacter sp.]|uniref:hypothetical protein n=1 Tax=Erythrobacter sp. TaxID=1042 RepID=UPI0032983D80
MAIDKDKQRDRWRRNKRDERARKKAAEPSLHAIEPEFEAKVWEERDRRLANFPWDLPPLPGRNYYPSRTSESSYPLICDVWAVVTLLEHQSSERKISDGMIADELWSRGRRYNLKHGSLRTTVNRARRVIHHLHSTKLRDGNGYYWPRYPRQVPEYGSGLKQRVSQVIALQFPELSADRLK